MPEMLSSPVDYVIPAVAPAWYVCANCGASGCKLWRQYQTFANHIYLMCVDCAGVDQSEDVRDTDVEGKHMSEHVHRRIDQIGWLVPAVPTEEGDTYWGYTSVPQAGVNWWHALPTRETKERGAENA